jgi:GT2 family glycosyltransferase
MDEMTIAHLESDLSAIRNEIDGRRAAIDMMVPDSLEQDSGDIRQARAALRSAEAKLAVLSVKMAQLRTDSLLRTEHAAIEEARNHAVLQELAHLRAQVAPLRDRLHSDEENTALAQPAIIQTAGSASEAQSRQSAVTLGYTEMQNLRTRAGNVVLPVSADPEVSVIVSNCEGTGRILRTLESIAALPPRARIEVILSCDCRGNSPTSIFSLVRGLRLVQNAESVDPLSSYNDAASVAHGRYLMFITAGVIVTEGWLDLLLDVFTQRADALIAGSKIISPDGALNQAGGVTWRDGSSLHYGRMDDARLPQYNYVRETDFVSAEALLVEKDFFRAVGGFDEEFSAGNLADADLAFKARASGFKVYYQPASTVVYGDGCASAPTSAIEEKFCLRWGDVLERMHFPAGQHLFAARERSRKRPCVLVIDHKVPQPDRDAGSRTMLEFMEVFRRIGVDVKFWPLDLRFDEAYVAKLQQLGIETFYGVQYEGQFESWIRHNGAYVDYVLLSRPDIAAQCLDTVRANCKAKVLYYGHDIHHLRIAEQMRIEPQSPTLTEQFARFAEIEKRVWEAVDVVYYPSESESEFVAGWLSQRDSASVVKTVPVRTFRSVSHQETHLNRRSAVLFVGGFDHLPNVDAAQWFVRDVLPIIRASKPDVEVWLVGSNPKPEVLSLAAVGVTVTGCISDEELNQLYGQARLAIAPLRYGAGVKAKVVEAFAHGLPVVTTGIGAQGLSFAGAAFAQADDAQSFAQAVLALLGDEARWLSMSAEAQAVVRNKFSANALYDILAEDVSADPPERRLRALSSEGSIPRQAVKIALTPDRQRLEDLLNDQFDGAVASRVLGYFRLIEDLQREECGSASRRQMLSALAERIKLLSQAAHDSRPVEASIIVPVYGQVAFTIACVISLLEHKCTARYDIILADDCSPDETRDVFGELGGVVSCMTHGTNQGFLRNCNLAARRATGKYVVFLNNDTLILDNWLDQLIAPFGRFKGVGLVGSKLLMGDGTLQEAGGIVWSDASAWNYGRGQDPRRHEFNYVRDVDYVSGASIAIPRELWNELGGFDERYVPAYCEDTDLAFKIRAKGLRTLYSPRSEVIHHEGVSHGTDTSSGIKAYQLINQEKFFAEWHHVLESGHYANGEQVFLARDRSRGRKHILVIDHYVPQYDKDGGSRMMYDYLRMFVDAGLQVTFWPDNLYYDRGYARALQDYGIDVMYGVELVGRFGEWIRENGEYFDYAFLSRAHICTNYIDDISSASPAKILYYGHDLTFPRLEKEYALTGRAGVLEEIESWRKTETHMWQKSDVIYYPAPEEIEWVSQQAPNKTVRPFRIQVYPNEGFAAARRRLRNPRAGSPTAVFVGGFAHRPNGDAVIWYVREILPLVKQQVPDIATIIVGSYPPPDVLALVSDDVVVTGYVSDPVLEWFYTNASVVIAPLRYGGGMKGKVIEAARFGAPVVTTSCGSEGFVGSETFLNIADTADAFAQSVVRVIRDRRWASERVAAGLDYVEREYGYRAVADYMTTDIPELVRIGDNEGLLKR